MARFLKVRGYSKDFESDLYSKTAMVDRWVNIYTIDEIIGVTTTRYNGTPEEETGVFHTKLYVHFGLGNNSAHYFADGPPEEWVAKIDALIAADIAGHHPDEDEHDDEGAVSVRPRGTWTKGETYEQLDMVDHPTEEGKRYIAVAASTSTAVTILSNKTFWCQLKDVE